MAGKPFIDGTAQAIPERGISEKTAKKYRYEIGTVPENYPAATGTELYALRGKKVHIANVFDPETKERIGQKIRGSGKKFAVIGNVKNALIGRHCAPAGGKVLVITEGEIDMLSYGEVRDGWPSVSLPGGVQTAVGSIKENLTYLESFDKVLLAFDNDEEGRAAIEKCKGLMSPGKMYVYALPSSYKDINEALQAGDVKAIMQGMFQAEQYKPGGLVKIASLLADIHKPVEWGLPWFFDELTKATFGRRWAEIYLFGAGTGIGKTDFLTEQIAFDVFELELKVGVMMLEQQPVETAKRIAGKIANRRFHVPDDGWTPEELDEAILKLGDNVTFYASYGETAWDDVKDRIRYMNVAEGIRVFYLDNLTAMIDSDNERASVEKIMKEMAGLVNELKIIINLVSHLSTADGAPHEEGGRVQLKHFKGSRAIPAWVNFTFGLERNQQAEDAMERHKTTFRVLKDRNTGQATGKTFDFGYNATTGRIIPYAMMDLNKFDSDPKDEDF